MLCLAGFSAVARASVARKWASHKKIHTMKLKKNNLRSAFPAFIRLALVLSSSAWAATGTWSGSSSGGTWDSSSSNWTGVSGTAWDATNGPTNTATFSTASLALSVADSSNGWRRGFHASGFSIGRHRGHWWVRHQCIVAIEWHGEPCEWCISHGAAVMERGKRHNLSAELGCLLTQRGREFESAGQRHGEFFLDRAGK